jgi:acetyltransferase-like isoleucine patch superfamily enzyme
MFSDDILIQTADQHGIVDLRQGRIINNTHKIVKLGDHVWVGRRCTLTSRCEIGDGSIIGTGAIVTGKIPGKVIAVGTPAKVIKEGTSWCRSPSTFDDFSKKYIEEYSIT